MHATLAPKGADYCTERVCVSVCPRSCLWDHTSELHHFFLRVTNGRGLVLFGGVMISYVFPVDGWRRICT